MQMCRKMSRRIPKLKLSTMMILRMRGMDLDYWWYAKWTLSVTLKVFTRKMNSYISV